MIDMWKETKKDNLLEGKDIAELPSLRKELTGDQKNHSGIRNGWKKSMPVNPPGILLRILGQEQPLFISGFTSTVLKHGLCPSPEKLSTGEQSEKIIQCMEKQENKIRTGTADILPKDNLFMLVRRGKNWPRQFLREIAIIVKNVVSRINTKIGWLFTTKDNGLNIRHIDLCRAI